MVKTNSKQILKKMIKYFAKAYMEVYYYYDNDRVFEQTR